MPDMTIARFAREGGVGVETVRYYQRRGLIREPARPSSAGLSSGVRRYSAEDVRQLRFIKSAQGAGFTLEEIRELLELDAVDGRRRARGMARLRIAALDKKIAELETARNALKRLADRCASGRAGPCPILTAFEPANSR